MKNDLLRERSLRRIRQISVLMNFINFANITIPFLSKSHYPTPRQIILNIKATFNNAYLIPSICCQRRIKKDRTTICPCRWELVNSRGRIRTCDLRVMARHRQNALRSYLHYTYEVRILSGLVCFYLNNR